MKIVSFPIIDCSSGILPLPTAIDNSKLIAHYRNIVGQLPTTVIFDSDNWTATKYFWLYNIDKNIVIDCKFDTIAAYRTLRDVKDAYTTVNRLYNRINNAF